MYMDHRIISKISKVLARMDMSVMLLDGNGLVILPEDDPRVFALPEALLKNPTQPMVYGGVTLIGTDDTQPVYVCLQGDSQEVRNCAVLMAQLISTVAQNDLEQKGRAVVLFQFPNLDEEKSIAIIRPFIAEDAGDMLMDMGRHTAAVIYHLDAHDEGMNVDKLLTRLGDFLEEGPMYFPEDMVTDHPERFIVSEIIREKILLYLEDEVPHGVAIEIESYKEEPNITRIGAVIYCERKSHKGIIIGKQGKKLKGIGKAARMEIEALIGTKVFLELWVKVKENWRDSDFALSNFGYKEE